jgi:hypothetical protein
MSLLPAFVDERFLQHRLRSTSNAGIACAVLALVLAYYRFFHDHIISRDLIAVAATFLVVKYVLLFWYRRSA